MEYKPNGHETIKSALFVDFDNVFSGLRKIDEDAAKHFATNPGRWLAWLERGLRKETSSPDTFHERSVLIRRCYLNPIAFGKYRRYFTQNAFSISDCPPLTQQGKNSTDIHMALDILDTLEHPTRFDEFIIFSGDSDFTPVLLRLRAYDRRTLIMTGAAAAQSYKAASDLVINGHRFIAEGLTGLKDEESDNVKSFAQSVKRLSVENGLRSLSARLPNFTTT